MIILLSAIGLLYLVLTLLALWSLTKDNHQPLKAVAWVGIIFALPVFGSVLYYFFGQNIRHERIFNRKSARLLTRVAAGHYARQRREVHDLPEEDYPLIKFFVRYGHSFPFRACESQLYVWGGDFADRLMQDIAGARHHIHLEFFIVEDDPFGRRLFEALAQAAARGVQVRLVYDEVGCWGTKRSFFAEMRSRGIDVHPFLPVRFRRLGHRFNYRNHRKLVVIDGQTGYIGGMNIAQRYLEGPGGQLVWRDLMMRVRGSAVYGIQQVFLEDWFVATREMVNDTVYYPPVPDGPGDNALMQIVPSLPFSSWANLMMALGKVFLQAREYIYLQTPYLMPPESILQALQTAAMSGVKVQIMVPAKPGGKWLTRVNESFYADLLRAGVDILVYQPGMLHAKSIVVDDRFASVGSANLDFRSLGQTFEANAIIYNRDLALRVKQTFEEARLDCLKVNYTAWQKLPSRKQLLYAIVRLTAPVF